MAIAKEMRLLHFPEDQIRLSEEEARAVLRFFFHADSIQRALEDQALQPVHREFAQALLVEAIDATHAMGFVQDLFMSVATGFRSGVRKIAQKFAKKALKRWFEHTDLNGLWGDIEIYETVRRRVEANFATTIRELIYDPKISSY